MSTPDAPLAGIKKMIVLAERTDKLGEDVRDIMPQILAMDRRLTRIYT